MANVYYGDGGVSAVTGNWNTASNWYSSLGAICNCGPQVGTPLGRVPNIATDTVFITCNSSGSQIDITTGPTGGWSGTLNGLLQNGSPNFTFYWYASNVKLSNGSYTGNFTFTGSWTIANNATYSVNMTGVSGVIIQNGTFNGTINVTGPVNLQGGTFNNTITVSSNNASTISGGTFNSNITFGLGATNTISGGNFNSITITQNSVGQLKISGGTFNNSRFTRATTATFAVSGGTWSPIGNATVNLATRALVISTLPKDPGFSLGGTLTPTYTITNIPDILGTGLI